MTWTERSTGSSRPSTSLILRLLGLFAKGLFSEWGVAAQGAPPKRGKESDEGDSGTIDEELDAVSRRAPPLALRDGGQPHPWLRYRP